MSLYLGLLALAGALWLLLIAVPRTTSTAFGYAIVGLLFGYAFLGRGFAYVGVPPVFVGELVLGLGLAALVSGGIRHRWSAVEWLMIAFAAWGLARTLPYVGQYGVDALRDAALWGYSLMALIVSAALVRRGQVERAVAIYGSLVVFFIFFVPVARLVSLGAPQIVPTVPGSGGVPLLEVRPGDFAVHLAAIAAFILGGVPLRGRLRSVPMGLVWAGYLVAVFAVTTRTRAAILALGLSFMVVFVLRPSRRIMPLVVTTVAVFGLAVLVNPSFDIGGDREVSLGGVAENARSIIGGSDDSRGGTREWRLEWWDKIISYTFRGTYFVGGKGFGINLADSDGFQVLADGSLRSPHNGHLSVLARMGVVGLTLWVALHTLFALTMFRSFLRARGRGSVFWSGVCLWILVHWLAALVNAAFDVYLEGPQGAIWLWSMMGLGLAVSRLIASSTPEELSIEPHTVSQRVPSSAGAVR